MQMRLVVLLLVTMAYWGPGQADAPAAPPPDSPAAVCDGSIEALVHWVKAKGGHVNGVAIRTNTRGLRGVIATRNLRKGEVVSLTPFSVLLNIEHALGEDSAAGAVIRQLDDSGVSETNAMGLFIAFQRTVVMRDFCAAVRAGGGAAAGAAAATLPVSSQWAPYVTTLPPASSLTTPLFYPPLLFDELIGTAVHSFAAKRRNATRLFYERFPDAVKRSVSFEDFVWGLSILWSRTFGVKVRDSAGQWQKAPCFVPIADMFNTGPAPALNADCRTNEQSTHFECFATRNVREGTELLAPYGHALGSGQLLLDYGLILPNNTDTTVPVDTAAVDTAVVAASPQSVADADVLALKERLKEMFKLSRPPHFSLRTLNATELDVRPAQRYGRPIPLSDRALLLYTRIQALDIDTLHGFKGGRANQNEIAQHIRDGAPFSLFHERAVVDALLAVVEGLLTPFTTSLADDMRTATAAEVCPPSYTPLQCAMWRDVLALRMEEKTILRDHRTVLRSYQKGIAKRIVAERQRHALREEL